MQNLRVRDLMTSRLFVVRPADPITTLQDLMGDKNIRHVPVVDDDGALVGLVSERDLVRRSVDADGDLPLSVRQDLLTAAKVQDIMTWQVDTIDADDNAATAAAMILDNKYGCLPVVEQGALVGILTESDFVRHVAETLQGVTSE